MIQRSFLRVSKEVSRDFQGSFIFILRKFQECLKTMSNILQENFKKSFNGVSRMFQCSFVLQFCCCMDLIAATRTKGRLVIVEKGGHRQSWAAI